MYNTLTIGFESCRVRTDEKRTTCLSTNMIFDLLGIGRDVARPEESRSDTEDRVDTLRNEAVRMDFLGVSLAIQGGPCEIIIRRTRWFR